MNPTQLLEHFDRISEAPDAVARLRRFILDLAVRGKLVEQDPNDEPAAELLKRIQAEKAKLISKGVLKREKSLPEVAEVDVLFVLPTNWAWQRLGNLANPQAGFAFKSSEFNDTSIGMSIIRIRDVGQPETHTFFNGEYRDEFVVRKDDYLISMDGNFRVAKWTGVDALLNQRVTRLQFYSHELEERLVALSLQFRLEELQGVKTYTTVDHLSGGQIALAVIGVPPLAEQHRIVAKVDELMALCDQLQAAQNEREARRDRLVAASLHQIQNPDDGPPVFLDHLPRLTTRPEHIKQLRQTILNLAVRGRLAPQDPNDEPAAELLKRIQEEKARLVKEGTIKKQQPLTRVGTDTTPFDVPEKWIWARLPDLCHVITDGEHLTPKYSDSGIPMLSAKHIGADQIIFDDYKLVSQDIAEKCWARCFPEERDILVVSRGAGVGRTIVSGHRGYCLMGSVLLFKPAPLVSEHFLCDFLNSAIGNEKLRTTSGASAQQAIYIAHLKRDYVVPLPPLAEQHRIVAKVDELMALCDQLEAQLTTTQSDSRRLLEAVLRDALAPALAEAA